MSLFELFERLMLFFLTPECFEDLFINFNFTNVNCLKLAISKCLGYGIIMGSLMIRVPQIVVILKAKSAEGISLFSELLMIIAVFGTMSYGFTKQFPISTYGDAYFLFIQSFIIVFLMLYYSKRYSQLLVLLVAIVASSALLFTNNLHVSIVNGLNATQLVLSLISKLNQAYVNYSNSSTGKLSPITLWLQFLGCVARIFTSVQETGDFGMILTYVLVSLANGLLVAQLLYYSSKTKKVKKTQ